MGMSVDELNQIKNNYIKEELNLLFLENFKKLRNDKNHSIVSFKYNNFYFHFEFKKSDEKINPNDSASLYEKIIIKDTKEEYKFYYKNDEINIAEIISNRIKWIMDRV